MQDKFPKEEEENIHQGFNELISILGVLCLMILIAILVVRRIENYQMSNLEFAVEHWLAAPMIVVSIFLIRANK